MILKIDYVSEQQLKNLVLFLDSPKNLLSNIPGQDDFLCLTDGQHISRVQGHCFKMAVLLNEKIEEVRERREPFQIGRTVIEGILDALERFPQ